MENASYPVGTCAERCALATAVVSVSSTPFLFLFLHVKGTECCLARSESTKRGRSPGTVDRVRSMYISDRAQRGFFLRELIS